jgi:penicillin-binding protein 1A
MAYSHQGIELKPIPGLGPDTKPTTGRVPVAESRRESTPEVAAGRPSVLTKRGADALVRVERLMDDATRALATSTGPSKATDVQGAAPQRPGSVASASDQQPTGQTRGN